MKNDAVSRMLGGRVLVGTLRRERRLGVRFTPDAARQALEPVRRPARIAKLLALAHHLQRAIDAGSFEDATDLAKRLHFTRARMSQLLNLLSLAPDIQQAVLSLEAVDGVEPFGEHRLRPIARERVWAEQRTLWAELEMWGPLRRGRRRQPAAHAA